jgi:hypothetical protein
LTAVRASALSAADVVRAWELGEGRGPVGRALAVLAVALPGVPREALARLSLGRRDAVLYDVRARLFGPEVRGTARCPACGEGLEFTLDCGPLRGEFPDGPDEERFAFAEAGHSVEYRLPNSDDVEEAAGCGDVSAARALLARRCLLRVRREADAADVDPDAVPEAVRAALAGHVAAADERAEVILDLLCLACEHAWRAPLEIAAFLWSELAAHVRRLAREVDILARAYGWSESEILAMSPARRRLYLEVVG